MECLQFTTAELAIFLAKNPTCMVKGGPYPDKKTCEAKCSSSGSGADGPCPYCKNGGPAFFNYRTTDDGTGVFGGGLAFAGTLVNAGVGPGINSCLWLGKLVTPTQTFLLDLAVTGTNSAKLYMFGLSGGEAVWTFFPDFVCCGTSESNPGPAIIIPFPGGDIPPSGVELSAGPC